MADVVAASISNPSVGGSKECLEVVQKGHEVVGELLNLSEGEKNKCSAHMHNCGVPALTGLWCRYCRPH